MFGEWVEEMTDSGERIEILNVSSSGSKLGWMMIVQYNLIEEDSKKNQKLIDNFYIFVYYGYF